MIKYLSNLSFNVCSLQQNLYENSQPNEPAISGSALLNVNLMCVCFPANNKSYQVWALLH